MRAVLVGVRSDGPAVPEDAAAIAALQEQDSWAVRSE
jgi:hypothetical protein